MMTVFEERSCGVGSFTVGRDGPTSEILDATAGAVARPVEEEETVCPAEEP
jgi:hypothetical protein